MPSSMRDLIFRSDYSPADLLKAVSFDRSHEHRREIIKLRQA